jgi:hypothetical protein
MADLSQFSNWVQRVTSQLTFDVLVSDRPALAIRQLLPFTDRSLTPDQTVWDSVFKRSLQPAPAGPMGADIPVRAFTRRVPENVVFRTYPVLDVANGLKAQYAAAVVTDLAQAAAVAGPALNALQSGYLLSDRPKVVRLPSDATEAQRLDAAAALSRFTEWTAASTAQLNALKSLALARLSSTGGDDLTPATLQSVAAEIAQQLNIAVPTITDGGVGPLNQTDRFQAALVQAVAFHGLDETAAMQPLAAPARQDIHGLLKLLSSYPVLQRKLGLILDVELPVEWTDLPATGTVSIRPTFAPALNNTTHLTPTTAFVAGASPRRFLPRARTPLIKDGFVDVADTSRFYLETLDVDGAALKAAYSETSNGNASPRTAGIALVFREKKRFFAALLEVAAKNTDLNQAQLFAEDLLRGVRIDVLDEKTKSWKSLCERTERFRIGRDGAQTTWPPLKADPHKAEGYVRLAVTRPKDTHTQITELQTPEVLARWEGWSLVVPLPQEVAPSTINAATENKVIDEELPIEPQYRVVPRSLPKLRFGRGYRVRARAVDLAGNSLSLKEANAMNAPNIGAADGRPLIYRRFEPVESPKPLALGPLDRNECPARQLDRLVVAEHQRSDDRCLAPGRVAPAFAEAHDDHVGRSVDPTRGAFDGAMLDDHGAFPTIDERERDGTVIKTAAYLHYPTVSRQPDEPYLPDPLAEGVLVTLTDRRGFRLPDSSGAPVELSYYGSTRRPWPAAQPVIVDLRRASLPLIGSASAIASIRRQRVRPPFDAGAEITLLPGEIAKLRVASTIGSGATAAPGTGHHLMALWDIARSLAASDPAAKALVSQQLDRQIARAQVSQLVPPTELTLVHAVRQPIAVALKSVTMAPRAMRDISVTLTFLFELHRSSTGRLNTTARWREFIDRPSEPKPQILDKNSPFPEYRVPLDPLGTEAVPVPNQVLETETIASVVQSFGDTKHRQVTYSASGFTRFREYYAPAQAGAPQADAPFTREAGAVALSVPSTARPDAPKLAYIIPAFEWSGAWDKSAGQKVSRRTGGFLRVYLDRPWYSSGEGEQLAVVLIDTPASDALLNGELAMRVTRWGSDPLWETGTLEDLPGQPSFKNGAKPDSQYTLPGLEGTTHRVKVVAFDPEFDAVRRMWRADIGIEPSKSYTPFVRLALARYQRESIENCHLSPPVLAEFAQLTPDRSACLVYGPNSRSISLSVVGVSFRGSASRPSRPSQMRLSLEEQCSDVDTDLGWHRLEPSRYATTASVEQDADGSTRWQFDITLPGSRKERRYRLVVEEAEVLPQDVGDRDPNRTVPGERITYIDVLGV